MILSVQLARFLPINRLTAAGAVSALGGAVSAHDVGPRRALLQGAVGAAEPSVALAPHLLLGVPGGFVPGKSRVEFGLRPVLAGVGGKRRDVSSGGERGGRLIFLVAV